MKHFRKLMVIALALILTFSLVGCGSLGGSLLRSVIERATGGDSEDESDENESDESDDNEESDAEDPDTEEEDKEEEDNSPKGAEWWDSGWYGWYMTYDTTGAWQRYEDVRTDICARITNEDDNSGVFTIWEEDGSEAETRIQFNVTFGSGDGDMGVMNVQSGKFHDVAFLECDWVADPSKEYDENFLYLNGHLSNANGSFYFHMFLRKWGTDWSDFDGHMDEIINMTYEDFLPRYYDTWYKAYIDRGMEMPTTFNPNDYPQD